MTKPGWATVMGVILILFGGCGAMNRVGEINTEKFTDIFDQAMEESSKKNEERRATRSDSTASIKFEELDSTEKERIIMFSDSIVVDSLDNLNIEATMKQAFGVSDYRKTWLMRLGWVGLIVSLLFIVGGIMLLATRKYTIQVVLFAIAFSMTINILRFLIFSADTGTGKMIGVGANIGIAFSFVIDIIMLILVLVSDKTYYKGVEVVEDYYDNDQL